MNTNRGEERKNKIQKTPQNVIRDAVIKAIVGNLFREDNLLPQV